MSRAISNRLASFYDVIDRESNRERLEKVFVSAAVAGFLLHLLLIFLNRNLPADAGIVFAGLGSNYLQAVYTPFSFILFYEVLLLVLALPKSLTTSIAKQYEIISLIVVRRVFKDIGAFDDLNSWLTQAGAVRVVLLDMGGALLMFLAVTAFYRVRQTVVKRPPRHDLEGFIKLKKSLAIFLGALLIGLAVWSLGIWLISLVSLNPENGPELDLDQFFFPTFFEFMIFTDVLLLIISIRYYDRYEYLFRNSGFVISTVLLRISLSTSKPWDIGIAMVAILYGLALISIFAWFTRMRNGAESMNRANAAA